MKRELLQEEEETTMLMRLREYLNFEGTHFAYDHALTKRHDTNTGFDD